jgi:hypothetical protein
VLLLLLLSLEIAMYSILNHAKVIDLMMMVLRIAEAMIVSEHKQKKSIKSYSKTLLGKPFGGFGKRGEQSERDIIHIVIQY